MNLILRNLVLRVLSARPHVAACPDVRRRARHRDIGRWSEYSRQPHSVRCPNDSGIRGSTNEVLLTAPPFAAGIRT